VIAPRTKQDFTAPPPWTGRGAPHRDPQSPFPLSQGEGSPNSKKKADQDNEGVIENPAGPQLGNRREKEGPGRARGRGHGPCGAARGADLGTHAWGDTDPHPSDNIAVCANR